MTTSGKHSLTFFGAPCRAPKPASGQKKVTAFSNIIILTPPDIVYRSFSLSLSFGH